MCIPKQDFLHGSVLAQIIKYDSPTNLKLVEKNPDDPGATYILNDDIALTILHRGIPRPSRDGISWTFQIPQNLTEHPSHRPHLALVCTSQQIATNPDCICLLTDEHLHKLFPAGETTRSITVRKPSRGKLRIIQHHREQFKIAQNAIRNLKLRP